MSQDASYYSIEMKDWRFLRSMAVVGSKQDHFVTAKGWIVIVSKDWPLKGWHVSIQARDGAPAELQEREVQRFFQEHELPYIKTYVSPRTGAINYHENIWGEASHGTERAVVN